MRHAAPHKNQQRFQRQNVTLKPPRRHPMATPVKKDREFRFSFSGIISFITSSVSFLRRHVVVTISLIVLLVVGLLVFGTRVFEIQTISYVFAESSEDCVSKSSIQESYFKRSPKVWSYFFMDGLAMRKKYPCLDTISFGWNPFSFNTLTVHVYAEKPVAQFTIKGGTEGDQIRYATREGNFISLVTTPSLPSFQYVLQPDQKLGALHIDPQELQMLLKLRKYMLDEFNSDVIPELTEDGTVRVSAPFAEQIYITLHDDLSVQLGSLQAILGMTTIDKKKILDIDLRFGNPVVKFKQ